MKMENVGFWASYAVALAILLALMRRYEKKKPRRVKGPDPLSSTRRYDELCKAIDVLTNHLKAPLTKVETPRPPAPSPPERRPERGEKPLRRVRMKRKKWVGKRRARRWRNFSL